MTPEQFEAACQGKRFARNIKRALRLVLVDGETWRHAARRCGTYESSIQRAKARLLDNSDDIIRLGADERLVLPPGYAPAMPGEVAAIVQLTGPGRAVVKRRIVRSAT